MSPFSAPKRKICWESMFPKTKKGYCPICGRTIYRDAPKGSKFAWDAGHFMAESKGGSNNPKTNCIPLCDTCNRKSQTKSPDKYIMQINDYD